MLATKGTLEDSYLPRDGVDASGNSEGASLPELVNRTVEVTSTEWPAMLESTSFSVNIAANSNRMFGKSMFWRRELPVGNPYSRLYWCWCAYILLLDATYVAFIVPIGVGFDTSYAQWNWTGYLDFIAGVSFAIELVLGWNVAYVATHKSQKLLILKRRQIASYYIRKGSFPFDFISTVIFVVECVGYGVGLAGGHGGTIIQIVQIARAVRLLRLLGLLQQLFILSLTAPQRSVPLVRKPLPTWLSCFLQLLYLTSLSINFLACLWVFVAQREGYENTWINNYSPFVSDYATAADATVLTAQQARSIPGPRVYLAAAYWSLTTVVTIGFGDVTPSTDAERAVMLVVELAGVVFFGILLGSVTSLLQRASQEVQVAEKYREKMAAVQRWMAKIGLPHEHRTKIRAYYSQVWRHEEEVQAGLHLFEDLPQHLKEQVSWWQNKSVMGQVDPFKDLHEDHQFLIAARARPVMVAPGHDICVEGSPADCIWLMHTGRAVALQHFRGADVEKGPCVLGLSALLAQSHHEYKTRPCGYRALERCLLWEVSLANLQPLLDLHEEVAVHLQMKAEEQLMVRQQNHSAVMHLKPASIGIGDSIARESVQPNKPDTSVAPSKRSSSDNHNAFIRGGRGEVQKAELMQHNSSNGAEVRTEQAQLSPVLGVSVARSVSGQLIVTIPRAAAYSEVRLKLA